MKLIPGFVLIPMSSCPRRVNDVAVAFSLELLSPGAGGDFALVIPVQEAPAGYTDPSSKFRRHWNDFRGANHVMGGVPTRNSVGHNHRQLLQNALKA